MSHRLRLVVVLLAVAVAVFFASRESLRDRPWGRANNPLAAPAAVQPTAAPIDAGNGDATQIRQLTLERLAYAQSWTGPLPPAMAAFREWTQHYRIAAAVARPALEPDGVVLARRRRAEMRELIIHDPQRALAVTVPAAVRAMLPPAILAELETRQAGRGDFALQASVPEPGATSVGPAMRRIVYVGGVTYTARAYGRRESQLTKEGASLHGIALDGEFALHENPLRVLEPGEPLAGPATSVCSECSGSLEVVDATEVNIGPLEFVAFEGRTLRVHETELQALEQRALRAEDNAGARVAPLSSVAEPTPPARVANAPTPHTIGMKQVLVIRTDFSDFPGEPLSQMAAQDVVDGAVKSFLEDNSYVQTTLTATVSNQVYRLPRTGASYATANDRGGLHSDARTLAGVDYPLNNYDRVIVLFPNIGSRIPGSQFTFAGLANVSGTNAWINGPNSFVLPTVSHELGHTYGLLHGNLWRINDGNPVSGRGNTFEYGDPFDMMGGTSATGVSRDARHHFSMWAKNRLGWLPDTAVTTATQSGTFRIHRFDSRSSPRDRPLALRIFRDGVRWYWVGLRQNFAATTPRQDGAYVIWGYNQRMQSQLLDVNTPGASANDAYIPMGTVFADPAYGITIKPVARGGTEPEQWLDLEVTVPRAAPNVVTAWGREGATFYDTESGQNRSPAPETNVPLDLRSVRAMAGGDQHVVALRADGTVVAWGDHVAGQISVPPGISNVVAIAAGGDHSGVVLADGTVRLWGETSSGVTTPPEGLGDVTQLAISRNHAVALKRDGTVVCWGANNLGQSTPPAGLGNVAAITAGAEFSVALRRDGTVTAWGSSFGRAVPAGLSNVTAISACGALTGGQFVVALKSDGTVVAWGANNSGQSTVPDGIANIIAIAAGAFHTVALKSDGTVVAWGSSGGGRTFVPPAMPKSVAVAASASASFALTGAAVQFLTQPVDEIVAAGAALTLRVNAVAATPVTYQWRKDGIAIAGATASTLTIGNASNATAGSYDVLVSTLGFTETSAAARVAVDTTGAPPVSRIANLSIRTSAGTDANMLIVGFSVAGGNGGTKPLLIRGVGPTLASFQVDGALSDPKIELYNDAQTRIQDNDNWSAVDASTFTSVGAFPLASGSRDAALYVPTLAPGTYSAQLSGVGNATGIVLAEIYDATSPAGFTAARPRLVNVSARAVSGTDADVLIAGFVIAGPSRKQVLIRAIGPTLEVFGVTGVLANPKLELFNSSNVAIQENDDWGGGAALKAAFTAVGAFGLVDNARDAALIANLEPGNYTAKVSGVGGTTGVALVEVYDLP